MESFDAVGSNPDPVTVTTVPSVPEVGVKPVIATGITVKALLDVVEPLGVVTPMSPDVAPAGTVTTIRLPLAYVIVPETPLKVTLSWEAMSLKPLPLIVTDEPLAPEVALIEVMLSVVVPGARVIDVTFPSAS